MNLRGMDNDLGGFRMFLRNILGLSWDGSHLGWLFMIDNNERERVKT